MDLIMYGYIRVSSKDQNTDRQWVSLLSYGIPRENIFVDKQSGKDFQRPQYRKLYRKLRNNCCLVVTSLDRLGRNYAEIQEQWRLITKKRKAEIVVLDMPLLDTRNHNNNLTGKFIADLVLQILSYVAEMERNHIRQRQKEGIIAAKGRGQRFGRPCKPIPPEFEEIAQKWMKHEIMLKEAIGILQVSRSWFYKKINEKEKQSNIK